jgi:hypothetical protein
VPKIRRGWGFAHHTGRLTAGNHNVGLRDRLLTLAAQSVDDQVPDFCEVLIDGTEPCGGLVVVGVDLLLQGVEPCTRLGLESSELVTKGVNGSTIRVGLDRPLSTRLPRAPTAASTAR